MSFTKPLSGYRIANTRQGDTLQMIALREMGDAARWYDLAQINHLLAPWITDNPALVSPRVLLAGTTISVPSTAPPPTGVADPASVYGIDLALVNGQISIGAGGDVQTVAGPDNIVQAVTDRLLTRPGELVYHPTYGCRVYDLLGGPGSPANMLLAGAWVDAAIKSDPRISSTLNTQASVTGDKIAVQSIAITVDGKHLPVGVV